MGFYTSIVISLIVGMIVFALLHYGVPVFISWKRKREEKYWETQFIAYGEWKKSHSDSHPDSSASGKEGALGIWLDDNLRLFKMGKMEPARALRLQALDNRFDSSGQDSSVAFSPSIVLFMSAVFSLASAFAAFCMFSTGIPIYAVFSLLIIVLVFFIALIDYQAHMIPFEISLPLFPLAIAMQATAIIFGIADCTEIVIGFLIFTGIFAVAFVICRIVFHTFPFGRGDLRLIPSLPVLCAAAPFISLAAMCIISFVQIFVEMFLKGTYKLPVSGMPFGVNMSVAVWAGIVLPVYFII